MIHLKKVSKVFPGGEKAVDALSLTVEEGELMGLIGPSGSGKTTTLKMINRLIEPTGGRVFVNGSNIMEQNPNLLRLSIGYVIQDIGLFPHYTIRKNMEIVPRLLNWPAHKIEKRYSYLLQLVDMDTPGVLDKKPSQLSGGQQQRIGLARALAANPPIVLLDEPFGALDPITRREIRLEFRQLQQKLNKTMVMVTHDTREAFELCDRIALLHEGHLQQAGTPAELLFRPANKFCKTFFDSDRFLLEMQTITLEQCLKYMEPVKAGKNHLDFQPGTSFIHVFECIETYKTDELTIGLKGRTDENQAFDAHTLLNGFYKAKAYLRSEHHA